MQHVRPAYRLSLVAAALLAGVSCASQGPVLVEAVPARSDSGSGVLPSATVEVNTWRVYAREHVDLWLHGFALLQGDSTLIPYFAPHYRQRMDSLRRQRNLTTAFDASRERLASYLALTPRLVAAQFLPLYFESWDELRQGFDLFVRANGNPRYGRDQRSAQIIAEFAASFPRAADRDWARTFVQALEDERGKFYHEYWLGETRRREPARTVFESAWDGRFRSALRPFFTNAQQDDGQILLSLTLGGEGRTLSLGRRDNLIAVPFPEAESHATDALYVILHELGGPPASLAVRDHTTPAEQRDGTSDRYASLAAVHAGALILARIAPDQVAGYQRFYLGISGVGAGPGDPAVSFSQRFSLPESVRAAVARQIDIILGGI